MSKRGWDGSPRVITVDEYGKKKEISLAAYFIKVAQLKKTITELEKKESNLESTLAERFKTYRIDLEKKENNLKAWDAQLQQKNSNLSEKIKAFNKSQEEFNAKAENIRKMLAQQQSSLDGRKRDLDKKDAEVKETKREAKELLKQANSKQNEVNALQQKIDTDKEYIDNEQQRIDSLRNKSAADKAKIEKEKAELEKKKLKYDDDLGSLGSLYEDTKQALGKLTEKDTKYQQDSKKLNKDKEVFKVDNKRTINLKAELGELQTTLNEVKREQKIDGRKLDEKIRRIQKLRKGKVK